MKIGLELQPVMAMRSGIGTYTYEITRRLKNTDNIEFEGLLFDFLNKNEFDVAKQYSFPLRYCTCMPYGVYRRIWHMVPLCYNNLFQNRANIFHFFNYIVPPRVHGKVITTVYDMTYKLFPETMDPKNLRRLNEGMAYSLSRSDQIITITKSSKEDILKYFNIPESKINIISPSFSIRDTTLQKVDLCKWGINSPYILFLGNLEPRKNITNLIKAYALIKKEHHIDQVLVVAGQKGWRYNQIFEQITELGLQEDIIFTGYISDEEKSLLYKNADAFVFPSLYEGFGMPILEAQKCGTPVLTSHTSSMPEVAGESALLVNPLDYHDISDKLYNMLTDSALRKELILKGSENIKRYTWDSAVKKLMDIYKTMS